MTAYELAKASGGRISLAAIYRLKKSGGRVRYIDARMLEAMCDVFGVDPAELLEYRPKVARAKREAKGEA